MSDPSADAPRRSGAGAIVGIALALMLCAGLGTWLYLARGGPIDGAATLEAAFGVRGLGERYAITDARELPSGARIVVLEDPHAQAEGAPSTEEPQKDERVDWRKVAIPESTTWPRRIVLTFPKSGGAAAAVDAFFFESRGKDLTELGARGGKVVVRTDKAAWRGFNARWIHERAYERPLTFRDAINVDLSLPDRPCVLTALWTRGEPASQAVLTQMLAALGAEVPR